MVVLSSSDPDSPWSVYQLALLTCSYVFGELSHFLIGVTSRDVARDVHYGDQACFPEDHDLSGNNETCLLYTSPSPRDLSTSRMPSSA